MAAPRLKAKKNKSKYKTTDRYIDAVYRNNSEYLIEHTPDEIKAKTNPKSYFKQLIKDKMKQVNPKTGKAYTANQAIKSISNSKWLNPDMTTSDIKHSNFENLLKKDKQAYKKFRNINRKNGRFTKFDYKKVAFIGYYNVNGSNAAVYEYSDGTIVIEYKSPQVGTGASIEVLEKDQFEMGLGKNIFYLGDSSKKGRRY